MEPKRRQQITLGMLVAVLAGTALYMYWPRTTASRPATSKVRGATAKTGTEAPITAPDVHLEVLNAPRPKPDDVNRNLFRFKPKPVPPPVAVPRPALPPTPSPPPAPSGPPPPPDIPLKFAMVMSQGSGPKVAVLLDTLGHQIYAREGEVIEGRYKVWKIGVESIEISYLDGRGRKTIRLSGS